MFLVIAWMALLASVVALTLLWVFRRSGSRFRRGDWLIPLAGIIVTIVAALIAYQVSNAALLFH
ncbi:MAG: hypothetical protein BGO04_13890 [Microbacterium sp. 70-38]|nr:MAG: hypothetical protein BGO04_13890 [Microbacterium sp. 70-38]